MSIGKWRRRLTKVHNVQTKFFKYCYLKLKRKLKKIEKLIKKSSMKICLMKDF